MKKSPKEGDLSQRALAVIQETTGESEEAPKVDEQVVKGASKGGTATAESLTPVRRSEIAKRAATARWGKSKPQPDES